MIASKSLRRSAAAALAVAAVFSAPYAAAPAAVAATTPFNPAPAVLHDGAPVPQPFGLDRMARIYQSDNSVTGQAYTFAVDTFFDLRESRPDILQQNLDKVVEINNAAQNNPAQVERALDDDHDDLMLTMADAWGPELAGHFRQAVAEGRLPKVTQLLSGSLARGGGLASSTAVEKYIFNYDRPFVVAPDRVVYYHRDGEDDEYSTTPSFPSGHTNQATWKANLMASLLPEMGVQMLARSSEVGYNRIVLGVHYPLDVIGGRMTGNAAAADRLRDPLFRQLVAEASDELRAELEWRCGAPLADCIARADRYLSDQDAVAVYTERMNYGFPTVYTTDAHFLVPGYAEELLAFRYPWLNVDQRRALLYLTGQEAGYPLDNQGEAGSWQRLNLARAWAANFTVNPDGGIVLHG